MQFLQFGYLAGYRTYILGVFGIIAIWAAFFTGEIVSDQPPLDLAQSIIASVVLLTQMTLRKGVDGIKNAAPILLALLMLMPMAGCSFIPIGPPQVYDPVSEQAIMRSRLTTFQNVLRINTQNGLVKPEDVEAIDPYLQSVRVKLSEAEALLPAGGTAFDKLMILIDELLLTAEGLQNVDTSSGRKPDVGITREYHYGDSSGSVGYQDWHRASQPNGIGSGTTSPGRQVDSRTVGRYQTSSQPVRRRMGRYARVYSGGHIYDRAEYTHGSPASPGYVYPRRAADRYFTGSADRRVNSTH